MHQSADDDEYYDEEEAETQQDSGTDYQQQMIDAMNVCNVSALDKWLDKIFPKVLQVLETNANSKTFDSY